MTRLRWLTAGESHGPALTAVLALGVAAIAGVNSLSQAVEEALRHEARTQLACLSGPDFVEAVTASLETVKPKSKLPVMELCIGAFLLGGFAWGFASGGFAVGADLLLYWVLWTGGLGALGCLAAGGHPLSILGAFVSSPFTPLHPALASGTVSALIEAWVRKPTYADFMALRADVNSVRGWWRNRVARVLVNFFLTSLGTAIGVWTGGARMLARLFA